MTHVTTAAELVDVEPADVGWVSAALGRWHCSERWSAAWAGTPSPHALSQLLWQGVVRQQVVRIDGERVALVQLAGADLDNGTADLELLISPAHAIAVEAAVAAFVDAVFTDFPFRKLVVALAIDDLRLPACLVAVARRAGCLSGHRRRHVDDHVDVVLYEIWADDWSQRSPPAPIASGAPPSGGQAPHRQAPPLTGRWVALEPLRSDHIGALHEIIGSAPLIGRWPRVQLDARRSSFERELWAMASVQYAVVRRDSGAVIGLVQGLNEDPDGRTVGLSVVIDPELWQRGWPFEAFVLMANVLFEIGGIRKIYCQMAESTRRQMQHVVTRWLTHEVTFERHERTADGGYEDWHIFALHRSRWDAELVGRVTGQSRATKPTRRVDK